MAETSKFELKSLREPFSSKDVEWRVGDVSTDKVWGRALPYLKFRAVADRLDDLLGADNWRTEYTAGPAGGVVCKLSLRLNDEWITKENGADNTDFEGVKGGLTDSFKRAAAMWGLGRYLYSYNAQWAKLDAQRFLIEVPILPDAMLPEAERGQARPEPETVVTQQVGVKADLAEKDTTAKNAGAVEKPTASERPTPSDSALSTVPGEVEVPEPITFELNSDGFPAGLTEAEIKKIQDVLARVNKDVTVAVLKNYVNSKGRNILSDVARAFILQELDKCNAEKIAA